MGVILQQVIEHARKDPHTVKIIDEERQVSLGQLLREAAAIRKALSAVAGPEQRIAVMLSNEVHFVSALLGILANRQQQVPLNFLLSPRELSAVLQDCQPAALLLRAPFKPLAEPLLKTLGMDIPVLDCDEILAGAKGASEGEVAGALKELEAIESEPEQPAVIIYTAGTTGTPRGVMLSEGNLRANYEGCIERWKISTDETFLCVLPLFHAYAFTGSLLVPLLHNVGIVMRRQFNPQMLWPEVERLRITVLTLVPAMYYLLSRVPAPKKHWLRFCISGGGYLFPSLEKFFQHHTGLPVLNGYGLTEAAPVISFNSPEEHREGSLGKPLPNVEAKLVGENGETVALGETGELWVKGENVMLGYFRRPEETAEVLTADGWLKTGDLMSQDGEGFLFFQGRKKELIVSRGFNIFPLEIETMLMSHPLVEEAAVVACQEQARGEYPVAFVKLCEGKECDVGELRRHCRDQLADYKVPRRFIFVADFPRNFARKILKYQLQQQLETLGEQSAPGEPESDPSS